MIGNGFFTLEESIERFGLVETNTALFGIVKPIPLSNWLQETLSISKKTGLLSRNRKALSEFIVAPILLELKCRNPDQLMIYSGKSMNFSDVENSTIECDFILNKEPATRVIQAPVVSSITVTDQTITVGLGRCVMQMVACEQFNQKRNKVIPKIYGCVTNGQVWHFVKLEKDNLVIDLHSYPLTESEMLIGVFQTIFDFY
jgi:hypothetical protein